MRVVTLLPVRDRHASFEEVAVPFPERLLGEYEEVVYDLHPHWWTTVGPCAVALVTVAAGSFLWAVIPAWSIQGALRIAVTVAIFAVLVLWVLPRWLRWLTTHFVVTTDRIIYRSGVLAKYAREIPLERVNDVTFRQSLWERVIRAGDLLIESAGEHGQSNFPEFGGTFAGMSHPDQVVTEIHRLVEEHRQRELSEQQTPPMGHRRSPLDDLERLADLRDRGAITEEEFQRKKRDLLDRI
jgi:uncharacterized membrane protein YdbT with pleckstrin-like domain